MHINVQQAVQTLRRMAILCVVLPLATHVLLAQRTIFPDPSAAKAQIHEALARAKATHKNVILDFGGNWCGDCQVLDIYFHDPANRPLLDANYELVEVNIGKNVTDANQDIAKQYGIPLKRGVPALVVLSSTGHVLYAQTNGEFESMGKVELSDVTKFLNDWKPTRSGASHISR